MHAAYAGQETLTFGDYIDQTTGKTLVGEPGGVYDIAPASGHVVPEIPVPWFTWIEDDDAWKEMQAAFKAARAPAESDRGETDDDAGDPED
jgi:hypothetical protein